ncbi:cytidine deaminase [Patescibacteria group bacterium]|nr:cytidine deaminase [Patescibacteria group bacterium]
MRQVTYQKLTDLQQKALDAAEEVLKHSYNPYSNFYVGATLIAENGKLISGTNFENAAYGSTICAERAAILKANSMGIRKFVSIAIIARGENFDTTEVTAPCGSCRQVLYEIAQLSGCDLEIILSTTKKDKIIVATIKELLPLGFGPLDLGIDITKYQKAR